MKQQRKIVSILRNNSHVNNYTKLLLYLNTLDYYEKYYIPNKMLMNNLKVSNNNVRRLLHQLENDKVIRVFYKNNKRYFVFIETGSKENDEEIIERNNELYDYNWLDDED